MHQKTTPSTVWTKYSVPTYPSTSKAYRGSSEAMTSSFRASLPIHTVLIEMVEQHKIPRPGADMQSRCTTASTFHPCPSRAGTCNQQFLLDLVTGLPWSTRNYRSHVTVQMSVTPLRGGTGPQLRAEGNGGPTLDPDSWDGIPTNA